MKELNTLFNEIQNTSLYNYKMPQDENFDWGALYLSADDYHNYITFKTVVSYDLQKTYICEVGNFYVDKRKHVIFIDKPNHIFNVDQKVFKANYIMFQNFNIWDNSIIKILYPNVDILEKN